MGNASALWHATQGRQRGQGDFEVIAVWPLCFLCCLPESAGRDTAGAGHRESGSLRANALGVNTKDHSALPGPLQVASDNQRSRGGRFSLETEKQDEAHKAMSCSIKGGGEPIQLGGKPERIALHWKQRPQGSWLKIIKSLQGHFT